MCLGTYCPRIYQLFFISFWLEMLAFYANLKAFCIHTYMFSFILTCSQANVENSRKCNLQWLHICRQFFCRKWWTKRNFVKRFRFLLFFFCRWHENDESVLWKMSTLLRIKVLNTSFRCVWKEDVKTIKTGKSRSHRRVQVL